MKELLEFIKKSPSMFHACNNIKSLLKENNFIELSENSKWNLKLGKSYYISRNCSSIIAFKLPKNINELSFNITAAHLDSPTFKLKPNFTLNKSIYTMLNTEVYGGPILNTWMDRPLDIVGKVVIKDNNTLKTKLVSFNKPMCIIPNCSIHYYPELNSGVKLNPQIDLIPLLSDKNVDLLDLISKELQIEKESIISHDLYLSILDRGCVGGFNNEFIFAPQIDNLECSFASIKSLIEANESTSINVCALFDSEEIGSLTRSGAGSKLLESILKRIILSLNYDEIDYNIALSNSFFISCDNAQGYHPNYPNKYDPTNAVYLNKGIVIKNAARGSYTTDSVSCAYFKEICHKANAKYQLNSNRSDVRGGSTLGAISLANVTLHSIDIGLPQISMHSCLETCGAYDYNELIKALKMFYSMHLIVNKDDELIY